jgi:hypothetical protein
LRKGGEHVVNIRKNIKRKLKEIKRKLKEIKSSLASWVIFHIIHICIWEHNDVSVMEIEK